MGLAALQNLNRVTVVCVRGLQVATLLKRSFVGWVSAPATSFFAASAVFGGAPPI